MLTVFSSDAVSLPLPPGHRFPQQKYALLRLRVAQMAAAGRLQLVDAPPATRLQLLRVHDEVYVRRVFAGELSRHEQREMGFPWSPELVDRSCLSTGATLAAARLAAQGQWTVHLAGGTHHAFADRGRGFCVFNDVAVAVAELRSQGFSGRIAVLDLDVHQGDGTADLFAHDPSVFTASVHGLRNYPLRKRTSDLDLALPDGAGDELYLDAVQQALEQSIHRSRPALLFYIAGADPYQGDRYGRMAVTQQGLLQRDRCVFDAARQLGLPVTTVMGGGYAPRVEDIVQIHAATVQAMAACEASSAGLGQPAAGDADPTRA